MVKFHRRVGAGAKKNVDLYTVRARSSGKKSPDLSRFGAKVYLFPAGIRKIERLVTTGK